ncbi:MAG: S8 family serine peptidase [Hamadaea sp.]|uniref:S8 family serine peptidase n=1 Tax=Hamadaea sp. TaxID=2024425 RepID=UPI0017C585E0|nr:S8 family serine peptidase [Hamadaea sp.]NUR72276.1 S8 family serine peptidase [Hamadaea sp.]NUT23232.1 S8 family serine peptidase [Hamadaea sp.]
MMRWQAKSVLITAVVAALVLPAAPAVAADATRSAQWWLSSLKVATAHKITQGRGVTVAVIDTGVFVHEDLKDRVLTGMDYTTAAGGNGQIDTDGHGTFIAGLISGRGHGTGLGLLGVSPSARILPLRVAVDRSHWPTDDTVAKAIAYARKKGAKIIHLPAYQGDQATMDAVAKAVAAGVMVVAATGNTTYDKQIMPPASWPGVVAVTGVDQSGKFDPLYVAGAKVDFAAPGSGMISLDKVAGKYVTPVSTGDASAVTVGVAALVWAKYPKMKLAEVLTAMQKGATDKGAKGKDNQYGYGIVNAANSLAAAQVIASPSPSASPSASPSLTPTEEAAATESAIAEPVADTKDTGGSMMPALGIGGGLVFLLLLATGVVLIMRRGRGGSPAMAGPAPPTSPWAPQQVQLPAPVAAQPTVQPTPVATQPTHYQIPAPAQYQPATAQPQQPAAEQYQQAAPAQYQRAADQTQQLPVHRPQQPAQQAYQPPAQAQTAQAPAAQAQAAQPMAHRAPVDAQALNQPTMSIPQPRFAFPGDTTEEGQPSIYDTATFPTVERREDGR